MNRMLAVVALSISLSGCGVIAELVNLQQAFANAQKADAALKAAEVRKQQAMDDLRRSGLVPMSAPKASPSSQAK